MANLSLAAMIIILLVCVIIALAIGYFIGSRTGGSQGAALKEEQQKHDEYKADVREHFQQTSAIMSRMVDDYRDMYQHMSEGAEKLAEIGNEKGITAPPPPKQISEGSAKQDEYPAEDTASSAAPTTGAADRHSDTSGQADAAANTQSQGSAAETKADDAPNATANPATQAGQRDSPTANKAKTPAATEKAPPESSVTSAADAKAEGSAPSEAEAEAKPQPAQGTANQKTEMGSSPKARHVPIGNGKRRK